MKYIGNWLPRIHCLVVGPGLGRDTRVSRIVKQIIQKTQQQQIPIVIDGVRGSQFKKFMLRKLILPQNKYQDGLSILCENISLIKNYKLAVLTPNQVEFSRLCEAAKVDSKHPDALHKLSQS